MNEIINNLHLLLFLEINDRKTIIIINVFFICCFFENCAVK